MVTIRPSTPADDEATFRLRRTTFGGPRVGHRFVVDRGGWFGFVAESDAELVGFLRVHQLRQYFGSRAVPMGGVASVAVPPHARGQGVASALLDEAMAQMRERGLVISTLFGAVPQLYRRHGWEHCGVRERVLLRPEFLAGQRKIPAGVVRSARAADYADIERVHRAVLSTVDGALVHEAPRVPPSAAGEFDICTVVGDPVRGYLLANRDEDSRVDVQDLVAHDGETASALLRTLWSWTGQTQEIELPVVDEGLHDLVASWPDVATIRRQTWMTRVVDVVGAVAARGWPGARLLGDVVVDIAIEDSGAPWNSGAYRLVVGDGVRLEPGGRGTVRFGPRGFAGWYTGGISLSALRRFGLVIGGEDYDPLLTALVGASGKPRMADFF